MDRVAGRMNLVDRQMNMRVVGVVMNGADPLMLGKAQPRANRLLNIAQGFRARTLAGRKRNYEVICLVRSRPLIGRLDKHNVLCGIFWRLASAVGDSHHAHALITPLRAGDVSHQPAEIALCGRLHGDVFCNHPRGPFLAAKILPGPQDLSDDPGQLLLIGLNLGQHAPNDDRHPFGGHFLQLGVVGKP